MWHETGVIVNFRSFQQGDFSVGVQKANFPTITAGPVSKLFHC